MRAYQRHFTRHVIQGLGGIDMADEFFQLHPELAAKIPAAAAYHEQKGGAAWKGAAIFHRFELKPVIQRDRRRACRRPIPK